MMVDAMVQADVLNKTMSNFGISFNNDFMILRPDDPRAQLLGQNNAIVSDFDEFSPVTKDFAKKSNVAVLLQNTRTISEKTDNAAKFKVTLIGKTSAETGVKLKNVNGPADLKNISQDRVEQGSFAVMATATGKVGAPATAKADTDKNDSRPDVSGDASAAKDKEVRIIGVGSVQFATNQGAQQAEHRDMFLNMVSYLTQDDDFISIRPKDATKSTLTLSSGGATLNLLFISFVYPFVFLGLGMIYWLRRKQA